MVSLFFMKIIYAISLFLLIAFANSCAAQNVVVYEKFADFEKAVIKDDGNVYVINFWATWCGPCVKELPYFEKLNAENKNVKVILVSIDSRKDLDKKLLPFIERKKLKSEVIMMSDNAYNDWLPKVDQSWSGSIPATLIIKGKKHLFAERDFESYAELSEHVNSFINLNK